MANFKDNYEEGKDYLKNRYSVTGWGQVYQPFLVSDSLYLVSNLIKTDSVFVANPACGGFSTRTFFQEESWRAVFENLEKDDIVIMQFGHNDAAKNKTERYNNIEGYKEFLRLYVSQSRPKGAIPIILTTVARNYPRKDGKLEDVHGEYNQAPKDVASEMNVLLIDLNLKSREFFSEKGKDFISENYFMNLPTGKYEAYPDGADDNTHFQTEGGIEVASLVFNSLKEIHSSINKGMKLDFSFFILCFLITASVFSQEKEDYKPYTIENTYQKLKKSYPDITPISPLVSDKIKYKEDIVYKKTSTSNLKLDVYTPKTNNRKETFPAVLLIHGGGWLLGSKDNQRVMAQHLALNGYVGIPVAYRLGFEAKYPAGVNDLKDAIVWAKKHAKKYKINPDKIAVLGASAGAQLATLIGVTPNSPVYKTNSKVSNKVQAIVNIDGVTSFIHPEAAAESKPGKSSMAGKWLNGEKEENFKSWKEASPLEYVDEHTPPTLFINSSKPRFHAGRDDMMALLNTYNTYTEMHTMPDSPHSFWLVHPWFETTLSYSVSFLNKILKE